MLGFITLIFCCQLVGELIAAATGIPLPGPVIGMVILLVGLIMRGDVPDGLANVGDTLLNHLSLLFVPAGVGVMLHGALLGRDWLPITVALLISTALTLVVTALLMVKLSQPPSRDEDYADRAGTN